MIARRQLLAVLQGAVLASLVSPWPTRAAKPDTRPLAALLLPLTGTSADLARSLQRAGELAQPPGSTRKTLLVFDTGTTPAGAAAAAAAAVRRGAPILVGPVFGPQVAAAVAAAGGVPVIALSNDASAAAGSFVLGITPSQAIGAILGYARQRGVRRVGIVSGTGRWETAAAAAATAAARTHGLALTPGTAQVDAVLVTGGADALADTARTLQGSGTQLLATYQGMEQTTAGFTAIEGAWLAAPDPTAFADFARRFETAYGNPPGQVAGLAYDAVGIARTLRTGGYGRDGMLASAGFAGITGSVRFRADGRATRELAIVVAEAGTYRTVARSLSA